MINTKYIVLPVVSALLMSGCITNKKSTAPLLTEANSIHASLPAPLPVAPFSTRPVPMATTYTPGKFPTGLRAGSDLISPQDLLEVNLKNISPKKEMKS
mgnify:CR=1 FL=1